MPSTLSVARDKLENLFWTTLGGLVLLSGDGERDMISILLRDEKINRQWFALGLLGVLANAAIFLYLHYGLGVWRKPGVLPQNVAPWAIPTGSAAMLTGAIAFIISWWPVLGWSALLIVPVLLMCFMTLLDLLPIFPISVDCRDEEEHEE